MKGTDYVDAGGVRMAYREAGSGEPLLLVHGNYASKRWFEEQLASPPEGWRLLAPDLPNFGESQPLPHPISIDAYARHLLAFADALGLRSFALLGHSLGGAVAQALAVAHPERVTHLLLIASAAPDGHFTSEEHLQLLESFVGNREALAQALSATMPTRRPPYFEGIVDDALAMRPEAYVGNARALMAFDVSDSTGDYPGPVLVVRGDEDLPHLITEEAAQRTAGAYERGQLESWEGVGHSPQIEDPARFAIAIERFLEERP